jgi:hypothetical protein
LAIAGAPRSMKMGTTPSPFPYDAAARHTPQPAKVRHPPTLHSASQPPPSRFCGRSGLPLDNGPPDKHRDRRHVPEATTVRCSNSVAIAPSARIKKRWNGAGLIETTGPIRLLTRRWRGQWPAWPSSTSRRRIRTAGPGHVPNPHEPSAPLSQRPSPPPNKAASFRAQELKAA